jgi:excisionase family DNA binding protein
MDERSDLLLKHCDECELLTVSDAAEWLNVSKSTVWRMIKRGDLPERRISERCVRVCRCDVDDMLMFGHVQ